MLAAASAHEHDWKWPHDWAFGVKMLTIENAGNPEIGSGVPERCSLDLTAFRLRTPLRIVQRSSSIAPESVAPSHSSALALPTSSFDDEMGLLVIAPIEPLI